MPQPRAWGGDKLVGEQILGEYNVTVDQRIATAKSEAIAAAEKKDQNIVGDMEAKIKVAADKVYSDATIYADSIKTELSGSIETLNTDVSRVETDAVARDNQLTETVSDISAKVDSLPTLDEVNSAISSSLTSVYQYKGSVTNYDSLPTGYGEAQTGWVYNTEETGMNYAWTGESWDPLGGDKIVSQLLTSAEYNSILNNKVIPEGASGKLVGSDAYLGLRLKIPDKLSAASADIIASGGAIPSGEADNMATAESLALLRSQFPLSEVWTGAIDNNSWTENEAVIGGTPIPSNHAYLLCLEIAADSTVGREVRFAVSEDGTTYTGVTISAKDIPLDADGNPITFRFSILDLGVVENPMPKPYVLYTGGINALPSGGGSASGGGLEYVATWTVLKANWTNNGDGTWTWSQAIEMPAGYHYFLELQPAGPETTIRCKAADGTKLELISYITPPALLIPYLFRTKLDNPNSRTLFFHYNPILNGTPKAIPIEAGGTGGKTAADAMKGLITGLSQQSLTSVLSGNAIFVPVYNGTLSVKVTLADLRLMITGSSIPIGMGNTDYTTERARAISLRTALPSSLVNGAIYGIYS